MLFAKPFSHHGWHFLIILFSFVTTHIYVPFVTKSKNMSDYLYLHFYVKYRTFKWKLPNFQVYYEEKFFRNSFAQSSVLSYMWRMLLHALAEPNLSSQIILHKFSRVISLFGKKGHGKSLFFGSLPPAVIYFLVWELSYCWNSIC